MQERIRTKRLATPRGLALDGRGVRLLLPFAVCLLVWEALHRLGLMEASLLPPPTTLFAELLNLLGSGVLLANLAGSLWRVALGYCIATLLGVGAGTLLGTYPRIGQQVIAPLEFLRPIPPIAWIPIAILWFGIGNRSAVFIVVVGAFFPILIGTYSGITAVNQGHINAAHCLGLRSGQLITDVIMPSALPQILTGMRIGMGIAWTSVIAAEMVGTREGLGYAIQMNRIMLEIEAVIVNMFAIGLVGWLMNHGLSLVEQRVTRWHRGQRIEQL